MIKPLFLGAAKCVSLIKTMIPKYRVSNSVLKDMITWCVTSFDNTPVTVSTIALQWIVGMLFCFISGIKYYSDYNISDNVNI